jgi:type I restriction enzyme R subunit
MLREAIMLLNCQYNFKDEVYAKEYVEFGPQHEALSIAKYQTGRTNCKPSGF